MNQRAEQKERVHLSVENVGGIDRTDVAFESGVNVLSGRNATNRTSLLRAVMAAMGSDDVSLKSDAEEGFVELSVGEETYTRRFTRTNGRVTTSGDPYLEDTEMADLFAFLLSTNETRQAVLAERDLRELIMRPVDTEAIEADIERLEDERDAVDDQLDELQELAGELPDLERELATLEDRIESKETELTATREDIEAADSTVDEEREEKRELDDRMDELSEVRSEHENVRQELRAQRSSLESLREKREELESDAESLPDAPVGEIEEIDNEIERLRSRKQSIQSEVNTLQRIVQFNEDNLEGTSTDILEALTDGDADRDPTDRLVDDPETVVCWTCGHEVDREDIEETLGELRDLRRQKLAESSDLDDRIDDLETERITYEEKERQRKQVRKELERTREQVETREEKIEDLEARAETLSERIDDIESTVESLQTRNDDTILALHKEASQLEVERNRLQDEREDVRQRIDDIENELDRREELETRREELGAELEELRTRIDRIESEAVDSFNHHMETVLDVLEYDNLARIWIERGETEESVGRRTETRREFRLHIVRESDSGAAYEDTIRHLSESEREVTGLVFALAGYLVHDVHEEVPFMLLDSLEAIDADRIAKLVDYFEEYPDYLVAALLPEDAAAASDDYPVVTEI